MRIAVNTRLLIKGRLEGLGRFCFETLKRMTTAHPEHEFFFLFDRPYDSSFVFGKNVTPLVIHPPARHPVLWHVWFELSLPRVLKRIGPGIFLSPDGFLSLKSDVLSLPVIHDLNFLHSPADLAKSHAWFYNRYFPLYAKKAARLATVSEFSKRDIVNEYGVSPERIDVVYNGVDDRFVPVGLDERNAVRAQWAHNLPYFVYVGAIHPRKNIVRLLMAYDRFRDTEERPFRLLMVGNRKWWTSEMQSAFENMKYREDVIFTGRISDTDLPRLIAAAEAQLYVSMFEGFGIPIIEAFKTGVPVITSNVTSMPEVAGDAALLVDPENVDEISSAMRKLARSSALRTELISKGAVKAKLFTWDRTADLLWESVAKAVS